ncbi:MAG: tRNA (N(6)-L-threonylcarbamoyladenosine(37)-C(2))-methylthiotransferase MtaB [Anaerorhabdus sp.]
MKQYAIACLGCKVNTTEAEGIREALNKSGYQETSFKEVADIYLILTCAVTNVASGKSRQKINQALRQNRKAIIGVIGCYVQVSADEIKENEDIDILVGSSHKDKVPELIERVLQTNEKQIVIDDVRKNAKFEALNVSHFEHKTRAYLKVQDGCNQFCSYCIIPYARGKERSLDLREVCTQAQQLSKNHQEIVLAGIHTGRYGQDQNSSLSCCIQEIMKSAPELGRLRISSIEVTEIDDFLLEMMNRTSVLAHHLHIPLQSGCDSVLKRMNRPYTTQEFYYKIQEIRQKVPHISISTDLIVGFPQETEEEFNQTVEFLKKCKFSFLHVFPFSAKKGTVAENFENQIAPDEKKRRVKVCSDLSVELYRDYQEKFIQKPLEVLVEKYNNGSSFGYSSEYLPVFIEGKHTQNKIVKVVCERIESSGVVAVIKEEKSDEAK